MNDITKEDGGCIITLYGKSPTTTVTITKNTGEYVFIINGMLNDKISLRLAAEQKLSMILNSIINSYDRIKIDIVGSYPSCDFSVFDFKELVNSSIIRTLFYVSMI